MYFRMIRVHQLRFGYSVACVIRMSGGRPADPGDVRMIREKVRMIRASQTARDFLSGTNFWAEMGDFRGKFEEISWMEGGGTWGNARSTRNQANPWIKINKTSSNQQITKNFGAILVGIFEFRTKSSKRRLENGGGGSEIMINMAHDTKMM